MPVVLPTDLEEPKGLKPGERLWARDLKEWVLILRVEKKRKGCHPGRYTVHRSNGERLYNYPGYLFSRHPVND